MLPLNEDIIFSNTNSRAQSIRHRLPKISGHTPAELALKRQTYCFVTCKTI